MEMLFCTPKVGKRGFNQMTQQFGGYSGQLSDSGLENLKKKRWAGQLLYGWLKGESCCIEWLV